MNISKIASTHFFHFKKLIMEDATGYWVSALQSDPSLLISYSNIHSDGHLMWVIVGINRKGSLMIAENPISKELSIWASKDVAMGMGIVSECDSVSSLSWYRVTVVTNEWLLSMHGVIGAHFDALGDLQSGPKRIGADVLFEKNDTLPTILRIDAYIESGEVVVSTKWVIHPKNSYDIGAVRRITDPLLYKISMQASEIDCFLSVNRLQVSFDNPRNYVRRDFYWIYSAQPARPSLINSSGTITVSSLLESSNGGVGDGGGWVPQQTACVSDRCTSMSPDTASSVIANNEGGRAGQKRDFFEVERMSTGLSVRGRRPGSKDTRKRKRGQTLPKNCYENVLVTLTKLEILMRRECDKAADLKDVCNQNICALFTITTPFDLWYLNKPSTLLNKRFRDLMETLRPLLSACPLLIMGRLSREFCESVKDEKTMEVYVKVKNDIVVWFQEGCKCDFFNADITGDGTSTRGSPSDTDWLDQNRQFLLERGISKLREINNAEKEKRMQQKLGDVAVGGEVKVSLATLQERLALAQDNITRGIKASCDQDDAQSQEETLRVTYNGFESVINKAVEIFRETNEVTERLKIIEQKRLELLNLFSSTSQKSANFTRAYIPQLGYCPEDDVHMALEEILRNATEALVTAPQFVAVTSAAGGNSKDERT